MDKAAVKSFAVWARSKLIENIKQRADELGITENGIKEPPASNAAICGNGSFNNAEIEQRKSLVAIIKEKGFNNVMEEAAYSWLFRILALRFMEVNNYLPNGVRVISSVEPGRKEQDIIREALNSDLDLDRELVYTLQDKNETETLYRYLLIKQCNALKRILPGLFGETEDYTEILLPSNLLSESSVIRQLAARIPEENFKDQVEIIGWMYQFYISEKKNEIFEGLKRNIKITKENIPAATQLFTPRWIVEYMVENTLGRFWVEGHPNDLLKRKWQFYIDETEQEVKEQLEEIRLKNRFIRPEDIKILDPAMGSGHILVYAFDVLYDIYKSEGYSEEDIPGLIIENNLYGLDIDDRAYQLAYFALMMKARSRKASIFNEKVNVNICAIQESNGFPKEAMEYLVNLSETEPENKVHREDIEYLINVFRDAKEYGALLHVKPVNFKAIERILDDLRKRETEDFPGYKYRSIILDKIPPLVKQAKIMSSKYDVVVTNPPYMGNKGINDRLRDYISEKYKDVKSDLFSVFIVRNFDYAKPCGHLGFMTPFVWMFISSYEKLREIILTKKTVTSLVQLEYSGFEEATVPICIFTTRNTYVHAKGEYIRLSDFSGAEMQPIKTLEAVRNPKASYRYSVESEKFRNIPGMPVAYWASNRIIDCFKKGKPLGEIAEPKVGLQTGDNDKFLRMWYEVPVCSIGFNCLSTEKAAESRLKWFPYNKGGEYRKWYGNHEYIVNWGNDGTEIKTFRDGNGKLRSRPQNTQFYFKQGITWSFVNSSYFSVRYTEQGFIFDVGGSSVFPPEKYQLLLTGLLCSKVSTELMKVLNPTLNFQAGNVASLPVIMPDNNEVHKIDAIVKENINISRIDWDCFEISWDFRKHPLLIHKGSSATIEEAFNNWSAFAEKQFQKLKANEEELNRIFIKLYGLQEELTPEVEERYITIRKADRARDIKSFISYAVGCMFGRYSIDAEGLIYAGGDFNDRWKCENGRWKVRKTVKGEYGNLIEDIWVDASFAPDMDNVLPVTDEEYFENDIVLRFVEFVKAAFGEDSLEENLDYIAYALGRKPSETARQAVRRYFLREFYKDHVKAYRRRPIYWLFDSGRQDGFKALIYMHRYDELTVEKVRTHYLHKLHKIYEMEIEKLDIMIHSNLSQIEKNNAGRKRKKLLDKMKECLQYDQAISHAADRGIKIDPDNGVKINYARFQGIEIQRDEGKPFKADLLAKLHYIKRGKLQGIDSQKQLQL